jgi:hypothetical protein
LHEIGERPLTVDLHDGDRRTVCSLELGIAADVDMLEVAGAHAFHDLERVLAEVTSLGGVDDDPRDRDPA